MPIIRPDYNIPAPQFGSRLFFLITRQRRGIRGPIYPLMKNMILLSLNHFFLILFVYTVMMTNSMKTIIFLCLVCSYLAQDVPALAQEDLNNPDFMKVLNNYFGCKTWTDGVCTECSASYYFNAKGICCEVKPECRNFNRQAGICEGCYQGYEIVNGVCVASDVATSKDKGCRAWRNGVCSECSARWYFGPNNVCTPIDDFCRTWSSTGECQLCYNGYIVQGNRCIRDPNPFIPASDSLCAEWKDRVCLRCSTRSVFDSNGICREVQKNCQSWDIFDGVCLACYKGYNLRNGACVQADVTGPKDLGCKRWDWDNQKCLECSARWVFGSNGVCNPVDTWCSSFDSNGACTGCYKGYNLNNGVCTLAPVTGPSDLGCAKWDWDNKKCLQCSARWTFGANGVCTPLDNWCSAFNTAGVCTTCYKGYNLVNGACVLAQVTGPTDLGCARWDWDNQKCLQCSVRWAFGANGVCTPLDSACASFDGIGFCTGCYKGYTLRGTVCVLSDVTGPTDLGCAKWDWDNKRCLQCSARWVFGSNGVCVPVDNWCSSFNTAGVCTACYKGYNLVNGACVLAPVTGPTDAGCAKWDWDNKRCLQCSARWVFNNGVCTPVDNGCSSFDNNGACNACYKGYTLRNGACVLAEQVGPKDLGCAKWDWDNQKCLQCSARWTFGANGVCVPVDNWCSSFDSYGTCNACYKGYNLVNGACVLAPVTGPSDLGCAKWDWDNKKCLQCSARWIFGANGVCVPVDNWCSSYDNNGACNACYKGYTLRNGACVLSEVTGPTDAGCARWDWDNKKCLQCSVRWTFSANGVCTPVDNWCSSFDANGVCNACYKGYNLRNGACVLAEVTGPTDLGCAKWDWDNKRCLQCSARWVFGSNGVCVPVDNWCSSFNTAGVCTACYKGYNLVNGACVLAPVTGPSDLGCAKWDWDNKRCLQCSARWVFGNGGVCVPVDNWCSSFDANGACNACYKGYVLRNGACALAEVTGPTDLGCAKWDWDNQKCLQCSARWVFGVNGVCVPVDNWCSSFDTNGVCNACYKGYNLRNGACVLAEVTGPKDLGCKRWDWDNQRCLQCSARWVFGANGVCTPVDNWCSSFNNAGVCNACYKGYNLSNGVCVLAPVTGPSDLGCARWDWDNKRCLQCSARWVFGANGVCVPVDNWCSSFDTAGVCTGCYKGYNLRNGACVLAQVTGPKDLGCKRWDWDNQRCLECSARWVFGSSGACVPVSDFCSSFNSNGQCTSCYAGYALQNGVCQVQNVLCKSSTADGTCTTCFSGYVLYKSQCVPLSKLANLAQYYAECCPQKLATLKQQNRLL